MLKSGFKLIIQIYWKIVPNSVKGKCLFDETCSRYVYRILNEEGFTAGVKALRYRFRVCRQPFVIRENKHKKQYELHLCNGDVVEETKINTYYLE